MADIKVGSIVDSKLQPHWGEGKVLCISGDYVRVGFPALRQDPDGGLKKLKLSTNVLAVGPDQTVEIDGFPTAFDARGNPVKRAGGKGKRAAGPLVAEVTLEEAWGESLAEYPQGFADPKYLKDEYDWKWEKHLEWQSHLASLDLRQAARSDLARLNASLLRVVQTKAAPLLHQVEIVAFRDALTQPDTARRYYDALTAVVTGEKVEEYSFSALIDAVSSLPAAIGKARVASWTALTAVPFLARPDLYLFMKPEPMKAVARRLGFELNYNATLNWETYRRLMELGAMVQEVLAPHGSRNWIDVQSFLWVLGKAIGAAKKASRQAGA